MKKLVWIGGMLGVAGGIFFGGYAPDITYRVLPGYFSDPHKQWQEDPFGKARVTEAALEAEVVEARRSRQLQASGDRETQILFGDTHVHTTNSVDAFMFSLPLMHGAEGAFPPGYACDYARFVSQLDFYFLTDHAESYEPDRWRDAIESVRLCNNQADTDAPDLMAFMGWEWTQVGQTADDHFGHHNVLFKGYEEGELPVRPIAAQTLKVSLAARSESSKLPSALQLIAPRHRSYLAAYNDLIDRMAKTPNCPEGIPSPELPRDCYETTSTPGELYRKLDEWGLDTIVIPHGSSWGWYTPPNASWEHQLTADNLDADKSKLIEVYSGHGNSENYRDFSARAFDAEGNPYCPEPQDNYLPMCWQAGEIIRQRCEKEGVATDECQQRAVAARQNFASVDHAFGQLTIPATTGKDWLDAGQARDVFLSALNYRPGKSVQAGLALRKFTEDNQELRFKWGMIGSTDTHSARAGHGYKQTDRLHVSDANGPRSEFWENLQLPDAGEPSSTAIAADKIDLVAMGLRARDFERVGSFLSLGGLSAVHVTERSRDGLWDAMKRREVYATSGPRILLWFDLLNSDGSSVPMGSEVEQADTPRFRVKALGSFKQLPGCPDYVVEKLAARHLEKMSHGECYYPSDERNKIDRIEIVRIRPQNYPQEDLNSLIDENWKVIPCEDGGMGCVVEFEDPEFSQEKRDTLYYVRAIEVATLTVNGSNLRTSVTEGGEISTAPCYGDYKLSPEDDCLAPLEARAWSSPIFVDYLNP
jgi:Protein of unknown function (DUF3604)